MAELQLDDVVGKVDPSVVDPPDRELSGHLIAVAEDLVTWVIMGAIVLGGVIPYIPQYRQIRRTSDAEGFSTFVCLVLLVANILRILFWFGKRYELPLLFQSIIMIITMLAMMQLCTTVTAEKGTLVTRRLLDFDYNYFWKWTRFIDYCLFVLLFSIVGSVVTLLLLKVKLYVELLGFASLLLEAMLGVPQLWRNFVNNSTEGMSVQMVLMWLSGDIFKTVYFIVRHAPVQFWVCGGLQVMVDVLILLQVVLYRERRVQLQPKSPRGKTTKISLT